MQRTVDLDSDSCVLLDLDLVCFDLCCPFCSSVVLVDAQAARGLMSVPIMKWNMAVTSNRVVDLNHWKDFSVSLFCGKRICLSIGCRCHTTASQGQQQIVFLESHPCWVLGVPVTTPPEQCVLRQLLVRALPETSIKISAFVRCGAGARCPAGSLAPPLESPTYTCANTLLGLIQQSNS